MEGRSIATWEEERRAPVRARGTEDGGGAAGPSTVKGKRLLLRCLNNVMFFLAAARWAGRCAERRVA